MALFFRCDNHDIAPFLDDLATRFRVLELWDYTPRRVLLDSPSSIARVTDPRDLTAA
jgi:hypothetical protein